jgi:hypothetical protein
VTRDTENDKPPDLKVVSDNPNLDAVQPRQEAQWEPASRDIALATRQARRKLVRLAATILRSMAGSGTGRLIMHDVVEFIEAEKRVAELTGGWLSLEDEANALSLPRSELNSDASENAYREYRRDIGMELIVQGALRLAAHQVLGERPHFGGKYSTRLIESGINAVQTALSSRSKTIL